MTEATGEKMPDTKLPSAEAMEAADKAVLAHARHMGDIAKHYTSRTIDHFARAFDAFAEQRVVEVRRATMEEFEQIVRSAVSHRAMLRRLCGLTDQDLKP